MGYTCTSPRAGATKCGWRRPPTWTVARGRGLPARWLLFLGAPLSPLRRTGGQDVTGWPANPKLVWHLKSNLIRTCVHVDEAVMGPQYTRTETERATTPYYVPSHTTKLLDSALGACARLGPAILRHVRMRSSAYYATHMQPECKSCSSTPRLT